MPETLYLNTAVFSKTPAGQYEIQARSLGLSPLLRRILVLVDGKRTLQELAAFVTGSDNIHHIMQTLLHHGCVSVPADAVAPVVSAKSAETVVPRALLGLPPAEVRTVKDNEMARNFMINSVNAIIGLNMRVTLITNIHDAITTDQLREVYHAWSDSMADHSVGAKRLPELREKLFKVL